MLCNRISVTIIKDDSFNSISSGYFIKSNNYLISCKDALIACAEERINVIIITVRSCIRKCRVCLNVGWRSGDSSFGEKKQEKNQRLWLFLREWRRKCAEKLLKVWNHLISCIKHAVPSVAMIHVFSFHWGFEVTRTSKNGEHVTTIKNSKGADGPGSHTIYRKWQMWSVKQQWEACKWAKRGLIDTFTHLTAQPSRVD